MEAVQVGVTYEEQNRRLAEVATAGGSDLWGHLLAPGGLALARRQGLDLHEVTRANDEKSPLMLGHEHDVTAFHLALNAALRQIPRLPCRGASPARPPAGKGP